MPPKPNQHNRHPTEDEFEQSWGLHEPLRLPTGLAGWDSFEPLLVMDELRTRIRENDYSSIVGVPSKREILRQVAMLIEKFPTDYQTASESISPEGWRMLYYSRTYVLGCLASPCFHADQELRHICEFEEFTEGLPAVWIDSAAEPRIIAHRTREVLDGLGSGAAKAAYSILAAAQRISLSKSEILRCEWWSPEWIQNLSTRINTGS